MYAISSVRRFLLLCSFLDSGMRVLIEAAKIPAFSYLLFAHFDAPFQANHILAAGLRRTLRTRESSIMGNPHEVARLYVNFFQPSFKLKSKTRQGAKVSKKYETPATPYERLLASDRVTNECKENLRQIFSALDPVDLLSQIRQDSRRWLISRWVGIAKRLLKQVTH
jgi:hypothetical protein